MEHERYIKENEIASLYNTRTLKTMICLTESRTIFIFHICAEVLGEVIKESKLSDNEITVVHFMYLPKESKLFTSE